MTRNTFTFRSSWYEAMSRLSGNVRLMLMDAVCRYAIYGELPEPMDDPAAEVAFILIRSEIDSAPCRGRKKAPVDSDRTAPVPEPEQAPASEPEPAPASESAPVSCSDTGDRPEPLSADTVRPEIPFDDAYDTIACKIIDDVRWCDYLTEHTDVSAIDMLLYDFRNYIIDNDRTSEFAGNEMSEAEFCEKLIGAVGNGFSPSTFGY